MLHFYDLYNYITAFLWQLIFSECSTILLLKHNKGLLTDILIL